MFSSTSFNILQNGDISRGRSLSIQVSPQPRINGVVTHPETIVNPALTTAPHMTTEFRNYVDSALDAQVSTTYRLNHALQTLAFVKKQKEEHMHFRKGTFDVWDIFHKLTDLIDESDPDNDKAQIFHAFQTAEVCFLAFVICSLARRLGRNVLMKIGFIWWGLSMIWEKYFCFLLLEAFLNGLLLVRFRLL